MLIRRLLYLLFVCYIAETNLYAQDIHWSQFNDNPIFQNPGNTGHFKGDMRFVANYRDQWRSVTVPFSTISTSFDTRLTKFPNIGFGGLVFHDVVGDGSFRTIDLTGMISAFYKLSQDSMHTIRPGISIGINHRQLNFNQLYFDSQFDGAIFNPSLPANESFQNDRKTNLNIGAGIIYHYFIHERFNVTSGLGLFNINRPNQGFYSDIVKRDLRMNIFGKGIYKLNYDWDLVPGINIGIQGKYREVQIGSSAKYTLVNKLGEYRAVYGGLWYRNKDAAYLSLGMDYQNWFVGLSYDINFSKLVPASRIRGGFEIAVRYVIFQFKPKNIVHRICPDYI